MIPLVFPYEKLLTIADLEATGVNLVFPNLYTCRLAAQAVVADGTGRIALLYIRRGGFHKLPGGGVEEGEDLEMALKRELLEEIGCQVVVARSWYY